MGRLQRGCMNLRRGMSPGGSLLVVFALTALTLASATGAQARTATGAPSCPSGGTPAPGSTVTGGLEVDGICSLEDVTVYGGISVDPSPESAGFNFNLVQLSGSTIFGGIVVGEGSVAGVGVDELAGQFTVPSTVNGGIRANNALWVDSAYSTIRGHVTGSFKSLSFLCGSPENGCLAASVWCGNVLYGNMTLESGPSILILAGDPGEAFPAGQCPGNTIHGSVVLKDSNVVEPFSGEGFEFEGNNVTASVLVDHSTGEVYGNTVGGSLLCTNGTVIQPPAPGDPSGTTNAVRGADTCIN